MNKWIQKITFLVLVGIVFTGISYFISSQKRTSYSGNICAYLDTKHGLPSHYYESLSKEGGCDDAVLNPNSFDSVAFGEDVIFWSFTTVIVVYINRLRKKYA